jgi:nitrile hydratase
MINAGTAEVPAPIVLATGETPLLRPGDRVRVDNRIPIGHYRVPTYLRGKTGTVETVIEPRGLDNEEEGFGRNAGDKRHYYRVVLAMPDLWPDYPGSPNDTLHIEVFETWLERIA